MVDAINSQGRIFSSDKKIYSGMTVREGGKSEELYKAFSFADKDKDTIISEKEIQRYDGPIVKFTKDALDEKTVGNCNMDIKGEVDGIVFDHSLKANGNGSIDLKTTAEYELYPGLTIEEADPHVREEFVKTDVNKNGELSLAEMVKLQIKSETGYDVEISEDMSRDQMKKIITQKRNEYDNEQLTQIRNKINSIPSKKSILKTYGSAGVVSGAAVLSAATAAIGEFFGLAPIIGGFAGGASGAILAGDKIDEKVKYPREEIKKQLTQLESSYSHTPEIKAQIEQMKKDNPWLAK